MASPEPLRQRCPSCEHEARFHQPDGCWYSVTDARPNTTVGCHCGVPRMAPVAPPTRGSGPVQCSEPICTGHRARCLFGRRHTWSTWYEGGRLMRTEDTYLCGDCGGVCTGEEDL